MTQFVPLRVRRRVRGEVRFDAGSRALYANDASNYRQIPLGVVLPSDVDDVIAAIDAARGFGAPIVARGGTGIPGQSSNVALMLDFSKYMHQVLEIDAEHRRARVEPGCNLDTLRDAAECHGITFGPDPATHSRNTLGGMIGNNSSGVHSVMSEFYGPGPRTSGNVDSLEILTYDGPRMRVGATSDEELSVIIAEGGRRGEIYAALASLRDRYAPLICERYPKIPRRVSGYNLDDLLPERGFNVARALVGSECTCITVLEGTVLLMESPRDRALVVLGYPDIDVAADHVPEIREFRPIALEGLDDGFVDDMKRKGLTRKNLDLMSEGRGWLLAEPGGASREEARANAQHMMDALKSRRGAPAMKLFDDPAQEQHVWKLREEGLGATAHVPGQKDNHEGWEDAAVPVDRVGGYMRELRALMKKYDYHGVLYGHLGQGCVQTRIDFDLETRAGIAAFESFLHEAAHLVVGYGGSLSGEHGDGQARGELLPIMFGDELVEAFREFEAIWDRSWKINPGKVVNAFRANHNLRLGTHYTPSEPATHFQFPDDDGSFARAANRCVGAGVCRRKGGGTMCPSFMVTLEEEHCTRGRPLYDWGMLDTAERLLHRILGAMRTQIEDGVPVVGLEPSCVSVFRDELCSLMPNDESAKRLAAPVWMPHATAAAVNSVIVGALSTALAFVRVPSADDVGGGWRARWGPAHARGADVRASR